jgi:hypothetical protein
MKTTVTTNDTPATAQKTHRPRVTVEPICADCQFSDVFATETRTHCEHPNAALHGAVLFAGQSACADFVPRIGDDLTISTFRAGRGGPVR